MRGDLGTVSDSNPPVKLGAEPSLANYLLDK